MGAEPWSNFAPYEADLQVALDKLRSAVFAAGAYRYAEEGPATIEEALEIADADGTASILDIMQVSEEPEYCCAAPFRADELREHFGSEQPTRNDIESADAYWEDLERGQARYVVVYEQGQPKELFFAGYSFD